MTRSNWVFFSFDLHGFWLCGAPIAVEAASMIWVCVLSMNRYGRYISIQIMEAVSPVADIILFNIFWAVKLLRSLGSKGMFFLDYMYFSSTSMKFVL